MALSLLVGGVALVGASELCPVVAWCRRPIRRQRNGLLLGKLQP